jgi:type IV pilus assembly protein PilO
MPDLRKIKTRMYAMVAALVIINLVCVAMLVTPMAGRESLRQDELRQLWASLKARESAPWRGFDKKIPQARQDIEAFYRERFPAGYSAISTDLARVASETGVSVSSERYSQKESDVQGLDRIEIEADVSGDYIPLMKFINSLERNKLFFLVDDLELGGQQSGSVSLRIRLETYLRST